MDHFLPTKNMPSPTFTLDSSDQSAALPSAWNSTTTSSDLSWSMDTGTLVYPADVSFWQDMTPYLCSSPTSPYKHPYDETPGATGNDEEFYAATESGPRRVRNKEARPEVILRRRAQNRVSQRAYRDRKDRRVKELETELATLTSTHEALSRDHSTLCISHTALLAAEKSRIAEKRNLLRSEHSVSTDDGGKLHSDESWSCEGKVDAGSCSNDNGIEGVSSVEVGPNGNFVVKIVVCKRCFGENAQVAGLSCYRLSLGRK